MTEENQGPVRVWGGIAVFAPIMGLLRDLRDVLARPLAFFGGLFGTTVLSGGLASAFMLCAANAEPPEDEFELEIQPGTLVRLGEKIEPKELPEKIIVEEQRVEVETKKEVVTKKEDPPEIPPKNPPKEGNQAARGQAEKVPKEKGKSFEARDQKAKRLRRSADRGDPAGRSIW